MIRNTNSVYRRNRSRTAVPSWVRLADGQRHRAHRGGSVTLCLYRVCESVSLRVCLCVLETVSSESNDVYDICEGATTNVAMINEETQHLSGQRRTEMANALFSRASGLLSCIHICGLCVCCLIVATTSLLQPPHRHAPVPVSTTGATRPARFTSSDPITMPITVPRGGPAHSVQETGVQETAGCRVSVKHAPPASASNARSGPLQPRPRIHGQQKNRPQPWASYHSDRCRQTHVHVHLRPPFPRAHRRTHRSKKEKSASGHHATSHRAASHRHRAIKPSSHQAIKPSSHQAIKLSSHQAIKGIKASSHQAIKPSSYQGITPSRHHAIKPSSHQAIAPKEVVVVNFSSEGGSS